MLLPDIFIRYTRDVMGEDLFARLLQGLDEEPPVSIRLNPEKTADYVVDGGERVPWCAEGYYLDRRPPFTFDPLLHAGCYYVQEAASMFVSHVLRTLVTNTATAQVGPSAMTAREAAPLRVLDLCAAPGGKTTAAMAALPVGSRFWANEPVRQRAQVLCENILKWGRADCVVTNSHASDYRRARLTFDIILADVPCSGEGMFRKEPKAVGEWSAQNVEKCWRLQREIVADIWDCLKPGGLLLYSTCTFNTLENEENVRWILSELDAEAVHVPTQPEWHITGSLLKGFDAPVYRFIPGVTRSEGLFMAVLRKGTGSSSTADTQSERDKKGAKGAKGRKNAKEGSGLSIVPHPPYKEAPGGSLAGTVALTYPQALAFLQRQALQLPEGTPLGPVEVTFQGHPLGLVKNIGPRANNLYPQEWRIKTTHIPDNYEAILRHP